MERALLILFLLLGVISTNPHSKKKKTLNRWAKALRPNSSPASLYFLTFEKKPGNEIAWGQNWTKESWDNASRWKLPPRKLPAEKLPPENCLPENCHLWKLPPMKIPTYESYPSENCPLENFPQKINPKKISPDESCNHSREKLKVVTILWWSWVSWKYRYLFNLIWIVVFI